MNSVFTFLLIAAIVAGAAYAVLKTKNAKAKKKAAEVNNSQVNPNTKVDGLPYDTSENDPTQR